MADDRDGYAFEPGLDLTTDGGRTWRAARMAEPVVAMAARGGTVFAATATATVGDGAKLYSAASGTAAWMPQVGGDIPNATSIYLSAAVDGEVDVLGNGGGIRRSRDGRHWKHAPNPCGAASDTPVPYGITSAPHGGVSVGCWDAAGLIADNVEDFGKGFSGGALPDPITGMPVQFLTLSLGATVTATSGAHNTLYFDGRRVLQEPEGQSSWTTLVAPVTGAGIRAVAVLRRYDTRSPSGVFLSRDMGSTWRSLDLDERTQPPTCRRLSLHDGGNGSADAGNYRGIALRNDAPHTCTIGGYPHIRLLDGTGLSTVTFARSDILGYYEVDAEPLVLGPRGYGHILLTYGFPDNGKCFTITRERLTFAPGSTAAGTVGLAGCNGFSESPVVPGRLIQP